MLSFKRKRMATKHRSRNKPILIERIESGTPEQH
jgi:hypothetical protein